MKIPFLKGEPTVKVVLPNMELGEDWNVQTDNGIICEDLQLAYRASLPLSIEYAPYEEIPGMQPEPSGFNQWIMVGDAGDQFDESDADDPSWFNLLNIATDQEMTKANSENETPENQPMIDFLSKKAWFVTGPVLFICLGYYLIRDVLS